MKPPVYADKLLKWFCAPHLLETIQGDLHEEFNYQVKQVGERKARWFYWWEVLGFIKPRYIKRQANPYPSNTLISHAMIRNYLKNRCQKPCKAKRLLVYQHFWPRHRNDRGHADRLMDLR